MKELICSLTHWFESPVYNIHLNVHTNRCTVLNSTTFYSFALRVFYSRLILNYMSNTNTTVKKYNMR